MGPRWRAAPPPTGFLRGISRRVNINQSRLCLSRDSERQRRSHSSLAGMLATIKNVKERLGTPVLTTRAYEARSNLPTTRGQKTHRAPPTGSASATCSTGSAPPASFHRSSLRTFCSEQSERLEHRRPITTLESQPQQNQSISELHTATHANHASTSQEQRLCVQL